jgi:hypothetical protein
MARSELFVRSQPGGVQTITSIVDHPGGLLFVSSVTGSNGAGYGQNIDSPLATLAYAVASVAAAGDTIYVLPGHLETIAGAAGIAMATAGVRVIGLGAGNTRPLFTWSATGSTWTISAANCLIRNIRTTSTVAAMVKLFSITAAGATFDKVDYFEDGTTDALQFILTTLAATDLVVENCHFYRGTTVASALCQWIVLTGADRAIIRNNFAIIKGAVSAAINSFVAVVTTACLAVDITGNRLYDVASTSATPILMLANTTGIISGNYIYSTEGTLASCIVQASCACFDNWCTNELAKSGGIIPTVDS